MRHFSIHNEKHGETGGFRKVAHITCASCGRLGTLPIQTKQSILPDEAVNKKFQAIDWVVGPTEKKDLCPECSRPMKTIHKFNGGGMVINQQPAILNGASPRISSEAPKADPPRVMDREHRRTIFAALTEHYVDEKTGYSRDWSDHRIATDLGVPRKWVEDIRDEMFGPISANPEMQTYLDEYKRLHDDARAFLERGLVIRKQVDAILADHLFANVQQIQDRIGALDKLADKVRKHGIS